MNDYSELKRLAEASPAKGKNCWYTRGDFESVFDCDDSQYMSEAEPSVILALIAEVESLRKDKDRLDELETNFWDVRHTSTQVGMEGDTSQSIEIVGSWMDAPRERVIGENYSENLRAAIDQAMTSDAYPPARPEYDEEEKP